MSQQELPPWGDDPLSTFAAPEASIQAAQQVTKTIPIIMAVSFDPVRVRIN